MSDLIPGGSYIQNPETGELTRNDAESTTEAPAPASAAESAAAAPAAPQAPLTPSTPVVTTDPPVTPVTRRQAPAADKD